MENIKEVANYLIESYEAFDEKPFDNSELLLHKLIYFSQRESIAITGEKLFNENIEGWRYGPVVPKLRFFFNNFSCKNSDYNLSETAKYIIDNVIAQYHKYKPEDLVDLTHDEYSWKVSRENLNVNERGNVLLKYEDIVEDAKNVRIYDHIYDMYIDEFEDVDEENAIFGF